jgi:hypothetical protein
VPEVAAPTIDWSGGTGAQNAAEPVSGVAGVVVPPAIPTPISAPSQNAFGSGGGGNDTFAYPIGG